MLLKNLILKEPAYFLFALTDGSDIVYRDAEVAAILAHLDLKVNAVSTATLSLPISSAQ